MIEKDLLDILACPICKGDVVESDEKIKCVKCGSLFPIRDGIPVMIVEEAQRPEVKNG